MRPPLAALIAVLALAGCGEKTAHEPFAESRMPPALAERFAPPEGWAWGFLQVGDAPVQRYGVAAPPGAPRGEVLILPDPGDSAEVWFETVRDLNARGIIVWVLEAPAQGGSGRYGVTGQSRSAAGQDAARGVRAMIDAIVRPEGRALIVMTDRKATASGLAGLAGRPVAGLVLSSPKIEAKGGQPLGARLGLGESAWKRDYPDDVSLKLTHDRSRGRVRNAWKLANPDLREPPAPLVMAEAPVAPTGDVGVLLLASVSPTGAMSNLCPAGRCEQGILPNAWPALHLEADPARAQWLDAIDRFVKARTAHAVLQRFSSRQPPYSVRAHEATGEETPQDAASERRGGQ